jgi:hypothetical protein
MLGILMSNFAILGVYTKRQKSYAKEIENKYLILPASHRAWDLSRGPVQHLLSSWGAGDCLHAGSSARAPPHSDRLLRLR